MNLNATILEVGLAATTGVRFFTSIVGYIILLFELNTIHDTQKCRATTTSH